MYDRQPETLTVDGIETAFFDIGSGPPLVMLHGMSATSDVWHGTMEAFSDEYRTIAPDLPGHGRSDGRAWPYSLRFYVRWLDHFLDALALETITLMGNSMGGAISLAYTLAYPHRVARLVMVDALGMSGRFPFSTGGRLLANLHNFVALAVTGRSDPYLYRFLRQTIFMDPHGLPNTAIQTMLSLNRRQGPFGFWSVWAGTRLLLHDFLPPVRRRNFARQLQTIAVPTLILWGRHDGLLPVQNARIAGENMPAARVEIFENSSHSPMLDEPEAFNRVVRHFLQETAGAQPKAGE